MHGEMFTHAEAASKFGGAAHSASSFDAATYCFTERHPSTAAHSAATPHTTADSYRFATPDSGAAPVATRRLEAQETMSGRVTGDG
jgi:hypothetical protein